MIVGAAVPDAGLTGAYLAAAVCFIVALKALSSPRRARHGNLIGVAGMVIAIGITLADRRAGHVWVIAGGMALGAVIGVPAARLVRMTAMPQMVAIFNGVGGAAAALVSLVEFMRDERGIGSQKALEVSFGVLIGCLAFAGSMVAFAKLQELMTGRPITFPFQQVIQAAGAVVLVALVLWIVVDPHLAPVVVLAVLALGLGAGVALPVGGADTPVLISLLNSLTGLAVAADGFVLNNVILIIAGTLVGASGALLTKMMSDGMGRSLRTIIFRPLATAGSTAEVGGGIAAATVRSADATDIGTLLAYAHRVEIVPGYGLAVAQAQHVVVELAKALEERGVEVAYAIHPVAGRMPGHMNVLLAEANVPYESLDELDTANAKFSGTDVALVVGANDVVNPAARDTPASPLYGMPILDVDEASHVVFLKRSMRPGFSGVDNALLYDPKTVLLFGDAADSLRQLVVSVKHA